MLCISVISWCYVRETEGLTFYLSMSFEAVPVSRFRSAKVERKARESKKKDEKMHFSQFVVAALRIGLDKLSIVARRHCAEVLRKPPDRE